MENYTHQMEKNLYDQRKSKNDKRKKRAVYRKSCPLFIKESLGAKQEPFNGFLWYPYVFILESKKSGLNGSYGAQNESQKESLDNGNDRPGERVIQVLLTKPKPK